MNSVHRGEIMSGTVLVLLKQAGIEEPTDEQLVDFVMYERTLSNALEKIGFLTDEDIAFLKEAGLSSTIYKSFETIGHALAKNKTVAEWFTTPAGAKVWKSFRNPTLQGAITALGGLALIKKLFGGDKAYYPPPPPWVR
jgi:hypothetical protein